MLPLLSLCWLVAGQTPIKVAAPDLTVVNLEPSLGGAFATSLAQQLTFRGVRTVTSGDLAAVLGLQRQQALLGCADDTCRAQAVLELGFDALLAGSVARFNKSYRLDVRLLEPGSGRVLAAGSATADDQDRLVANFALVADQLAQQISSTLHRPLVPSGDSQVITRWSTLKKASFIPLALGVVSLAAGSTMLFLARDQYNLLASASPSQPLSPEAADRAVSTGKVEQSLGFVGLGVGAGLLAAAAGLFLFGGEETVSAGVAVSPQGLSFGVQGAF